MNKNKIVRHLSSNALWYAIILVVNVLLWSWIFGFITAPKKEETVYYYVASYGNTLSTVINDENNVPQGIKQVLVNSTDLSYADTNPQIFVAQYQTFGTDEADIIILPQDRIDEADVKAHYRKITADWVQSNFGQLLQEKFGTIQYLTLQDGSVYGIKIYDGTTNVGCATDYVNYTAENQPRQNYYILFTKCSVHLSSLDETCLDDNATVSAQTFIGL